MCQVPLLDIPYATPLVYQFDDQLRPLPSALAAAPLTRGYYLGDAARIREVQRDIRESLVCETAGGERARAQRAPLAVDGEDTCFVRDEADGSLKWSCEDDVGAGDPPCGGRGG